MFSSGVKVTAKNKFSRFDLHIIIQLCGPLWIFPGGLIRGFLGEFYKAAIGQTTKLLFISFYIQNLNSGKTGAQYGWLS